MDIGKAFGYAFEDDQWIPKILIAAGILLAGIVLGIFIIPAFIAAFLLSGYGVEITRRVINGTSPVLPEWDNWGDLLIDGLKVWVIGIVYALPMILVGMCLGIPGAVFSQDSPGLASAFSSFAGCLNFLWGIILSLFMPAAIALFVANDDLGAAFRFGEVFNFVRDNFSNYLIVLVLGWVASLIGFLGIVFCFLPVLVTAPYASWITSHLYGQAYREGIGRASQPVLEETA